MKIAIVGNQNLKPYVVDYNGWLIHVEAKNEKSAKYKAWQKFIDGFPTDFLDFVRAATVAEDWSMYHG